MRRTIISAVLLALVGCKGFTSSFVNSNIAHRPMVERRPDQVQMFASGPPKRSYVEVGILEGEGGAFDDPGQVLERMRQEGGRLGCEALIVTGPDDSVSGYASKGSGSTTTYKGFLAVCILFDPEPRPT